MEGCTQKWWPSLGLLAPPKGRRSGSAASFVTQDRTLVACTIHGADGVVGLLTGYCTAMQAGLARTTQGHREGREVSAGSRRYVADATPAPSGASQVRQDSHVEHARGSGAPCQWTAGDKSRQLWRPSPPRGPSNPRGVDSVRALPDAGHDYNVSAGDSPYVVIT